MAGAASCAGLVRNKAYPQSGGLRVNLGNIYFEQKKFPLAIKMYRMALDQVPQSGKEVCVCVCVRACVLVCVCV